MTQPRRELYQSYWLHCWQESGGLLPNPVWRFSLEDPHSRQQQEFPNLRELIIALNTALIESRYQRPAAARRSTASTDQTPEGMIKPRSDL
ncbi:MAG: hypothetical protein DPW09_19900 [Anaerolineae bacterium]|nr:hypothetical protein [Anaerolineales bacterium]MCQ3975706.1 hypothetical protein [Anaerolineae bacterium]